MVKGQARHVLILLYNAGLSPQEIIELGYPKASTYKYNFYFKKALEEFKNKMKK